MPQPLKVLFVEDNEDDARLLVRELERHGYIVEWERVETKDAMIEALTIRTPDVIIDDYYVPGFESPQALDVMRSLGLDLPFVIATGGTPLAEVASALLKAGASSYVGKDWPSLVAIVERDIRNAETRAIARSLLDTVFDMIGSLVEARDAETHGHTRRVTEVATHFAESLGIAGDALIAVRRGAALHDLGKLGVPDRILRKRGPLTPREWKDMQRHPLIAYELLSATTLPRAVLEIPYSHHEWWNGEGYPQRLMGEAIPLAARLFAVVDIWDALRFDRPYRAAWEEKRVRAHLVSLKGTTLEPRMVDAFLELLEGMS